MQRRRLLLLASLAPAGLFLSRYLKGLALKPPQSIDSQERAIKYREQAIHLNDLAAEVRTIADARAFVDFVVEIFSDELPPHSVSRSLRERTAQAEFAAVTDPQKLIPEERIAAAWNTYVSTLEAPRDHHATAAEIHNLRDAFLTTASTLWARGSRNIWAAPAIYAVTEDGAIAEGCRAIESIRILWDLANQPDDLLSARVRVSKGVLLSEQFRQVQEHSSRGTSRSYVAVKMMPQNPIEAAEREYVAKHGIKAFAKVVNAMLDQTLIERAV